jgi:uncharacterized phage protein (TIGR01671 family)
MREIKFRSWDKKNNRFLDIDNCKIGLLLEENTIYVSNGWDSDDKPTWDYDNIETDRYIFEQFTGLQDRNGKDIYEGDLLRNPAKGTCEKHTYNAYEVFWHDNDCADSHIGWQMDRIHPQGHSAGGEIMNKMLPKYTSKMEIIGNIHENPELL